MTRRLPITMQPSVFNQGIPVALLALENVLRVVVFAASFAMPLELSEAKQRLGLVVFSIGTLVYLASWLPLMIAPTSGWSASWVGFAAPAYTPAIWLFGLALMGQRLWGFTAYRWWFYLVPAVLFLVAHLTHAVLAYQRAQGSNS